MEDPVHLLAQIAESPLPAPQVAWRAIAPELALAGAGLVLLMVVAFWPNARRGLLAFLTLAGLAVAAALVGWNWDLRAVAFDGAVSLDGITRYARIVLLAVGALTTLMALSDGPSRRAERTEDGQAPPELYPPPAAPCRCCCSRSPAWCCWRRPPTCWWCSSPWRSCRCRCTSWPAPPAAPARRRRP